VPRFGLQGQTGFFRNGLIVVRRLEPYLSGSTSARRIGKPSVVLKKWRLLLLIGLETTR